MASMKVVPSHRCRISVDLEINDQSCVRSSFICLAFGRSRQAIDGEAIRLTLRKNNGSRSGKEKIQRGAVRAMSAASAAPPKAKLDHTTAFENITTERDLLAGIRQVVEEKRVPALVGAGMVDFYNNYRNAVVTGGAPDAEAIAVKVMAMVFDRILVQFEDPYTFPSYHRRMLEPYDYYTFGQEYVRPLIDFSTSYLGNPKIFDEVQRQLDNGENVVLLANHQTEADPAVMALMLEHSHPRLATELTYIAGDRVVLDPVCKPFSMGRNLLCVYSKKRINDVPELTAQKLAANRKTLKEMSALFKKGGLLVWVAPSGGRDRPDPVTNEWVPAPFDAAVVETMRRLACDSGPKGHLYPTTLLCYDIMPPPRKVEKELGERRLIGHHGIAVSVGEEVIFEEITRGLSSRNEARDAFGRAAFEEVVKQYDVLKSAIHGGQGLQAATTDLQLSQPWIEK